MFRDSYLVDPTDWFVKKGSGKGNAICNRSSEKKTNEGEGQYARDANEFDEKTKQQNILFLYFLKGHNATNERPLAWPLLAVRLHADPFIPWPVVFFCWLEFFLCQRCFWSFFPCECSFAFLLWRLRFSPFAESAQDWASVGARDPRKHCETKKMKMGKQSIVLFPLFFRPWRVNIGCHSHLSTARKLYWK